MPAQNFFEEIKRRKLHKVAISYTVVSWLQIQVGDIMFPAFGIPDEWMKALIILLVTFFPAMLILAWFYDIGPDGISRIAPASTKGTKKSEKRNRPLTSNLFIGSVLLLLLLQYLYFNFVRDEPTIISTELSADIRLNKIAILPFENLSDSSEQDNLGEIAAHVITLGFTAFDEVAITSPFTIENNLTSVGILPDDIQGRASFFDLTGAQHILSGTYLESEGQIVFELDIRDTSTEEIKFIFPPIMGSVSNVDSLLLVVRERVLGYWVKSEDIAEKNLRMPRYTAHEHYLNMFDEEGGYTKSLAEILAVDSMFHLARIHVLNLTRWYADTAKLAHFEFLDRYRTDMTTYEGLWYDYVRYLYQGDVTSAYNSVNELREKFPGDQWINHDAASVAYNELGNYELSRTIYEQLPIRNYEISGELYGFSSRVRNQIVNYAVLGEDEKLKAMMAETPRNRLTNYHHSLYAIMTADNEAYDYWLKAGLKRNDTRASNLVRRFAYDYRSTFSTNTMNSTLVYETARFLRSTRESSINTQTLTRILEALDGRDVSLDLDVSQETIFYTYWTALGMIKNGDREGVKQIIRELEKLVLTEMSVTKSYQVYPYYVIGCIYAQMGEESKAITYLKRARSAGLFIGHYHFKYDKHLQPLANNGRFVYLNEPVEP